LAKTKHIFVSVLLPRDATQNAVMPRYVACPSIYPSETLRYCECDHTGWQTSKIISHLITLRFWLGPAPTSAIGSNGNTPNSGE